MASVTYLIVFDVLPARRDDFLNLLNPVLDEMRHETNFRDATLHRDPGDENRFMLCETWASHQDVVDVQLSRAYRAAWHEALPALLRHDRAISIWQPLRSDGLPAENER